MMAVVRPTAGVNGSALLDTPAKTPAAGASSASSERGLWQSILESVRESRSIATKSVLVCGTKGTGKTTLVRRVASTTGETLDTLESSGDSRRGRGVTSRQQKGQQQAQHAAARPPTLDLGLSYASLDVHDEDSGDDETIARLSIYQVPSPDSPFSALVPLALPGTQLLDAMAVIVLDWTRPWDFVSELSRWINMLERAVAQAAGAELRGQTHVEDARAKLENQFRTYSEPKTGEAGAAAPASSHLADDSPLPEGVLSDNLGIPLVIVCAKADDIDTLEREGELKDDDFDYIQQVLRTVALKYGASVFYTSQAKPTTFRNLRSYVLHRLFGAPATTAGQQVSALTSRSFAFGERANVVDRDGVLVPSGWDSWGKIKILRDSFEPSEMSEAWETTMREHAGAPEDLTTGANGAPPRSAAQTYKDVVSDPHSHKPATTSSSAVEVQNEQDFLRSQLEVLQKERGKDPRSAFASRAGSGFTSPNGLPSPPVSAGVGPMGTSAVGMPTVEKVLEARSQDTDLRTSMSRQNSSQDARRPTSPPLGSSRPGAPGAGADVSSLLASQGAGSAAGGGAAGQGQNEVLANFFQSLLAARTTGGGSARSGVQGLRSSKGPSSSSPPTSTERSDSAERRASRREA